MPNLGPYSIGPAHPEAVIEAQEKRHQRDPLADMLDGGRVTETEWRAVLREFTDLAGYLGRVPGGKP